MRTRAVKRHLRTSVKSEGARSTRQITTHANTIHHTPAQFSHSKMTFLGRSTVAPRMGVAETWRRRGIAHLFGLLVVRTARGHSNYSPNPFNEGDSAAIDKLLFIRVSFIPTLLGICDEFLSKTFDFSVPLFNCPSTTFYFRRNCN